MRRPSPKKIGFHAYHGWQKFQTSSLPTTTASYTPARPGSWSGKRGDCGNRSNAARNRRVLARVARQVGARGAHREQRLQRAAPFGPPHFGRVVIEQLGVVPGGAQPLDQAARLPVRAVVDAAVEGEHADFHALVTPERA